jgi:hypothetical protein
LKKLVLALALAAWATACGLDVVEIEMVEEGAVGLGSLQIPGLSAFGSSLQAKLNAEGVNPADVDSLRLVKSMLEMTSQGGLTGDLGFFKKFRLLVEADALPQTLAAQATGSLAGKRNVELQVTPELELKPYLQAGGLRAIIDAELDPLPPDRVDLRLSLRLRVDVNL